MPAQEPDGDEGGAAKTPPSGQSPGTQPAPNNGLAAAGIAELSMVVRQLERLLTKIGAASDAGRDVTKAISSLVKHIPSGSVSPGMEMNAAQGTMNQMRQQAPLIAALRAQSGGAAPGAAAPPAAGMTA